MTYQEFSNVLERKPDGDQEKVIQSLANTIVSAGAGSGKTQTLASRFAYLIAAGFTEVDRILTLTFTKKAAAEMYQRIYRTLKRFAQEATDPDARGRAQKAIDNFSKAKIQTLDSYSAGILRQAAARYGIRPDFTAGADSSKIRDLAFDFAMQNRTNPALQWISAPAKLEECAGLFADAANQNASLKDSINEEKRVRVFAQSLEKQKKRAEAMLDSPLKNPFELIESALAELEELMPPQKPKGRQDWYDKTQAALAFWNSPRIKAVRQKARDKDAVKSLGQSEDGTAYQNALNKFVFANKITCDESINALIKGELCGEEKKSPGLIMAAQSVITFYSDLKYLEGLHELLDNFATLANEAKRKSGELTFKDINDLALRAIKDDESLRKQERDAHDFIMIDEFQDNNADNRDLLLEISKDDSGNIMKNRLFFVGDEKQSIYKFRGADVAVFNSLDRFIGECQKLPMQRNYRSNNILLDGFNQIFGGFLPSDKEIPGVLERDAKIFTQTTDKDWEAKFDQKARAIFPETKEPLDPKSGARISFCLFPSGNPDPETERDAAESKAFFIAKKILALHEEEKIPYSKIALLLKSRTHYAKIARAFLRHGIPFSLDQQGNIFYQATANDFYSALRLCAYPADINAYAAFLASPLAGMEIDGVEKILSLFPKRAFEPDAPTEGLLDERAQKKYLAAKAFYENFAPFALSNPIEDSIKRLWEAEGYKFSEAANEEHYDLLFELARKADADGKDLSWFVDRLANEKEKISFSQDKGGDELDIKEVDYPVENSDAVSVMTIHKSKGLEFDHVFVWGIAESKTGNNASASKVFHSDEFGAVVSNGSKKQNLFALLAQEEEDDKNDAEARRLIYVAMTRAAQSLYVVGNEPPSSITSDKNRQIHKMLKAYEEGSALAGSQEAAPFAVEHFPYLTRGEEGFPEPAAKKTLLEKKELWQSAKTLPPAAAKNFWASPSCLEEKKIAGSSPAMTGRAEDCHSRAPARESFDGAPASFAYPQINPFVNESALAKNDYGSLFHKFMEDWSHSPNEWTLQKIGAAGYFDKNPLLQKISAQNKKTLLETFFLILDKFLAAKDNPAAQALKAGRPYKAECRFKTKIASYIITGSMDAVFQNADGTWTVLDYKTDARPDASVYYNQLACYKKTAADLFADGDQSKVQCLLFFAESGLFANVSQEAQKALENLDDEKIFNLIEKDGIL